MKDERNYGNILLTMPWMRNSKLETKSSTTSVFGKFRYTRIGSRKAEGI
jgi:hypothetical protein